MDDIKLKLKERFFGHFEERYQCRIERELELSQDAYLAHCRSLGDNKSFFAIIVGYDYITLSNDAYECLINKPLNYIP